MIQSKSIRGYWIAFPFLYISPQVRIEDQMDGIRKDPGKPPTILTEREVSETTKIPLSTLRRWRYSGKGIIAFFLKAWGKIFPFMQHFKP
jgi:hypothetical protein